MVCINQLIDHVFITKTFVTTISNERTRIELCRYTDVCYIRLI